MDNINSYSLVKNDSTLPRIEIKDTVNVISGVAFRIILLAAASLALVFALHPIGAMVHIPVANFTMRLPLLIASGTGITTIFVLAIQIYRGKVKDSMAKILGVKCRKWITPQLVARNDEVCFKDIKVNNGERDTLEVEAIEFETEDKITLRGYWAEQPESPKMKPTVIIFHGNGELAKDMKHYIEPYFKKGYNVLIPDYRGCGMSKGEQNAETCGTDAQTDALAAYNYVHQFYDGKSEGLILCYGRSLGGAYATTVGVAHQTPVILEHAFSTIGRATSNLAKVFSKKFADQIVKYALSEKEAQKLDNEKRIGEHNFELYIVEGEKDSLMKGSASDLVKARKNSGSIPSVKMITGGHNFSTKAETKKIMSGEDARQEQCTILIRAQEVISECARIGKKLLNG